VARWPRRCSGSTRASKRGQTETRKFCIVATVRAFDEPGGPARWIGAVVEDVMLRHSFVTLAFTIAGLVIAPGIGTSPASAADEPSSASALPSDGAAPADATSAPAPTYRLPKVGKPRGRIGGGRRGPLTSAPEIRALVPDHVGQTTSAQPNLYWYLDEAMNGDVVLELTLVDEGSIDPILDRTLERPTGAGLQRVRLSDLGISLEPGQEYQWSVAVVPDPTDHSKDVITAGWVERVAAPDDLTERLAAAGPDGAAWVYGEAGLWYDMLDAAVERIRSNPDSDDTRAKLAAVLEQAGLPGEAAQRRP
jgi:hypothetical protein